jgi:hypothetical protein
VSQSSTKHRLLGTVRFDEYPCFLPIFWVGGLMMSLLPSWDAGALTSRRFPNSKLI